MYCVRSLAHRPRIRGSHLWTLAVAALLVACGDSSSDDENSSGSSSSTSPSDSDPTTDTTGNEATGTTGPTSTTEPGSGTQADSSSGTQSCETPEACAQAAEDATAAAMEALRDDPDGLLDFLVAMPLGGDLHHHLSGGVYAETYLAWAEADGDYCITTNGLALSFSCGDGNDVPVPTGRRDLYLDVVRAWSMFEFVPSGPGSGANHFFSTFSKFGAISGSQHGRMLADIRRRAATENVLYIEPMLTSNSTARSLGEDVWQQEGGGSLTSDDYASFHAALLAASGFPSAVDRLTDDATGSEQISNSELSCNTAQANLGCTVETRYQAYISRSGSDSGVFAQMVAAYEAAAVEPRIVGLNLVGPEDGSTAMANYDEQMDMLSYLGDYYADQSPLRLSLHAGEITAESIPDGYALDETQHIRKAVEIAGARRIGHGVDVLDENDPDQLLEMLREQGILVEICLASNDIILEIVGEGHPVHDYLEHGVPVSLATDDQGVARSSLAAEFFRAAADQGLDYGQLKGMVRASLEYSFLPGDSLWSDRDLVDVVDVCAPAAGDTPITQPPSQECLDFLATSDRARLQRRLEQQFEEFEAGYL